MRIACITVTPFAHDGRVQRAAKALEDAGHMVLVIAQPPFPETGFESRFALPPRRPAVLHRLGMLVREGPATVLPRLAGLQYWMSVTRHAALGAALRFHPDAVLCNDPATLPIGTAVKRRLGARVIYDSHEFATREHIHSWKWRLVSRAAVTRIEGAHIAKADLVVTVSEGIALALQDLYRLPVLPLVVRNVPAFTPAPERRVKPGLTVLFHGVIRADRGLEQLIESMRAWTFDGRLIIRGYGAEAYIAQLMSHSRRCGCAERVAFEPRVSPATLIEKAAEADVGYLALPETSDQYRFALPNKLFEYAMAGLAVLATPRNEIARFVEQRRFGVISELNANALAKTLNGLANARLEAMQTAALAVARDCHWDAEKQILLNAVARLSK